MKNKIKLTEEKLHNLIIEAISEMGVNGSNTVEGYHGQAFNIPELDAAIDSLRSVYRNALKMNLNDAAFNLLSSYILETKSNLVKLGMRLTSSKR